LVKIRLLIARVTTSLFCKTFKVSSRVTSFDCLNLQARLRENRFGPPQSGKESCLLLRRRGLWLSFRNHDLSSYDENVFVDLKLERLNWKFFQILPDQSKSLSVAVVIHKLASYAAQARKLPREQHETCQA